MNDNIKYWFSTENGTHIPVKEGETKEEAINKRFNNISSNKITNRKELTNYVKEQINLDIESLATEKQTHPRSYLNIDTRNLSPSQIIQLKNVLKNYGHNLTMESNGVYDYAISYEKK